MQVAKFTLVAAYNTNPFSEHMIVPQIHFSNSGAHQLSSFWAAPLGDFVCGPCNRTLSEVCVGPLHDGVRGVHAGEVHVPQARACGGGGMPARSGGFLKRGQGDTACSSRSDLVASFQARNPTSQKQKDPEVPFLGLLVGCYPKRKLPILKGHTKNLKRRRPEFGLRNMNRRYDADFQSQYTGLRLNGDKTQVQFAWISALAGRRHVFSSTPGGSPRKWGNILGVVSPFRSSIVRFKAGSVFSGFWRFSRKKDPWKEKGPPRNMENKCGEKNKKRDLRHSWCILSHACSPFFLRVFYLNISYTQSRVPDFPPTGLLLGEQPSEIHSRGSRFKQARG